MAKDRETRDQTVDVEWTLEQLFEIADLIEKSWSSSPELFSIHPDDDDYVQIKDKRVVFKVSGYSDYDRIYLVVRGACGTVNRPSFFNWNKHWKFRGCARKLLAIQKELKANVNYGQRLVYEAFPEFFDKFLEDKNAKRN